MLPLPLLLLCQGRMHWMSAFTSRLTGSVKLVGSTISCEGSPLHGQQKGRWRRNPHVQSYAVATDKVSQLQLYWAVECAVVPDQQSSRFLVVRKQQPGACRLRSGRAAILHDTGPNEAAFQRGSMYDQQLVFRHSTSGHKAPCKSGVEQTQAVLGAAQCLCST
jgi:hypothetical protein